ncbi:TSUP family transporter [Amphritea balenae]|uniref:Probable membrane transporter protein n=1 Tax=Amphritea balenae TaxID=452629 RepID=A0A3P1SQ57_9GAMM|nr:TSUP family transporter [Amphritea balenae]RRC99296.1 sulfite exporter TauE/SafE family protein [Amphritea balenae]GGK72236.1 membrane protein [Amphritea balenae]
MTIEQLLPFLLIVAFGTYVQTVTGFALGMIVLGCVAQLGLASVTFTSVIISLLMLANGPIALRGNLQHLDHKAMLWSLTGLFPALVAGVLLLNYLSSDFTQMLQWLLGATIITGGLFIMLKPEPLPQRSSHRSFAIAGAAAGIFGGLFSIAGPPLVYQLYRQPLSLQTIRLSLLAMFLVMNIIRLLVLGVQGLLTLEMLWTGLICIPVVAAFTLIGKRYPPPFSDTTMRRLAFALLIIIGISLVISA